MELSGILNSVIHWPKISDLYAGIIIEANTFPCSRPQSLLGLILRLLLYLRQEEKL